MADVSLTMPEFDSAPARAYRAMDKTLRTWGFEVERRAKIKSRVDTGFNKNTIYTITQDGSIFVNMQRQAQRPTMPETRFSTRLKKSVKRPTDLAEFQQIGDDGNQVTSVLGSMANIGMFAGSDAAMQGPQPAGRAIIVVEVRVGSAYGIYLEMGTVRMAARPFLGPAAEEVAQLLDGLMTKNLKAEGF